MGKLDEAVASALGEVTSAQAESEDEEGTAEEVEAPESEEEAAPESQEVASEVESEGEEEEAPPTHLFGVDLSALPDEARREFIHEWQEQNKTISKLQREKAELAKATPPEPEPPAEEAPPLTDEALAQALGIDLENTLDEAAAKAAISLARGFIELRQEVEGLVSSNTVADTKRVWESKLDELEAQYGQLPVDRIEVLEWAADNGVSDPTAAYWAQAGPIRFSVMEALDKKMQDVRKSSKKAATTPRPKASVEVEEKLKATTAKEAAGEAARAAIKRLGIRFDEV